MVMGAVLVYKLQFLRLDLFVLALIVHLCGLNCSLTWLE